MAAPGRLMPVKGYKQEPEKLVHNLIYVSRLQILPCAFRLHLW